ncbi:uncharacterized protein B0I36DRAFT_134682 [Microdochium trichocladiopsis]|uniref:Zn(2)-C6 fungal-type domain-containing protein n=1 Tax=Microdochium trichocladiopsis TaxID=1682393 RepID=A0A9P9BPW0_9PEZI|nr:uncharacterized protein B0I36DRAFT_134682 [Microdochium trichocladiopsis]KAH7029652.1 hypothetical protein B0I36DRAFT_134682 [Microdochium trichocladiopsis]
MPKPYRPLLPASRGSDPSRDTSQFSATGSTDNPSGAPGPRIVKRRLSSCTACVDCRARKKKCNGAWPACSNCVARGTTACQYKHPSMDPGGKILELLRSLSLSQAHTALAILRSQPDEGVVLASIKHDTEPLGVELQSRPVPLPLESELLATYPNAYLKNPVPATALRHSHLMSSYKPPGGEPSLQGYDHGAPSRPRTGSGSRDLHSPRISWFSKFEDVPPIDVDSAVRQYRFPLVAGGSPAKTPELYDRRLKKLDISFWTNVDVANSFAAQALSLYLETDHPYSDCLTQTFL